MLRIPFAIILATTFLFANTANAASLFFTPGTGEFGLGKEIAVDLKIDSAGVGINAGQATIRFPKEMLEVKSIDKTDSTFNFWLEEPAFSNTDGAITFVGGTPYGISGASIQVLHIVFITKSSGVATVSIVDSAVTASDGSGTNVLTKTNDAAFTIPSATVSATVTPVTVVPPTQIKREPVAPSGLPIKPVVSIPLYGDPAGWSNHSNIFSASWGLPLDISGVATAINKQPNFSPSTDAGLFDNKMFESLSNGTWYLHVRFRNDIGWGPTAHYRIGVDTEPPLPFELTSNEKTLSDDPTLVLNFKTSDAISGISKYQIKTDGGDWATILIKDFKGTYTHHDDEPGKHTIFVRAVDGAGNSIEDSIEHEVTPLASPTFTFVTTKLFSDEVRGLTFRGTGLPSTEILLLLRKGEAIVASSTIPVDVNGNWELTSSDLLLSGRYIATIQNKDARGARSLVVTSDEIKVTGRYTTVITIALILLLGSLIAGYIFYKARRERTSLRVQVAERDTANVFNMIKTDIQKLQDAQKTETPVDDEFLAEKLKKSVEKMGSYVKDEIGRAKE